jgi:hypothetical protein
MKWYTHGRLTTHERHAYKPGTSSREDLEGYTQYIYMEKEVRLGITLPPTKKKTDSNNVYTHRYNIHIPIEWGVGR